MDDAKYIIVLVIVGAAVSQGVASSVAMFTGEPTLTSSLNNPAQGPDRRPQGTSRQLVSAWTKFYDIRAGGLQELRDELDFRGPRYKGHKWHALTKWRVSWEYEFDQGRGICAISSVKTKIRIKHIMPRWANEESAPGALRASWKTYYDALMAHEKGHARNGELIGKKIGAMMLQLPPMGTCVALGKVANTMGRKIIEDDTSDEDYDLETDHGANQGVVLR